MHYRKHTIQLELMSSSTESFNREIVTKTAKLGIYTFVAMLVLVAAAFVQSMMAIDSPSYEGPGTMLAGCLLLITASGRALIPAMKLRSIPKNDGLTIRRTLFKMIVWHMVQTAVAFGAFIASSIGSFALAGIVAVGALIFVAWTRSNYR